MKVPPKVLRNAVRGITGSAGSTPSGGEDEGGSDMLPDLAAALLPASEPSLPVLEAFQQFLEMERQRTRTRLWMVMVWFLAAFLALSAVVLSVSLYLLNRGNRQVAELKDQLRTLQTESTGARLALRTDAGRLRDDLEQEKRAVNDLQADLRAQIGQYSNELRVLKGLVSRMEEQSTRRTSGVFLGGKPMLSSTNVLPPAVPSEAEEPSIVFTPPVMPETNMAVAVNEPEPPVQGGLEPEPPVPSGPASTNTLTMMIVPDGMTRVITWQLPIPPE